MGLLKNIFGKKKKDISLTLKNIMDREMLENKRMCNEEYYWSYTAKNNAKQIQMDKNQYLDDNPKDFLMQGMKFYQHLWGAIDHLSSEDKQIIKISGMGKYYEDMGDYEKAIECYEKAYDLTHEFLKDEIEELISECGEGEYLYAAKLKKKIGVCKNKIFMAEIKSLENKAKNLEKENPIKAIDIYEILNKKRPNIQKYNNRIKICNNILLKNKIKMLEENAKDLENTNPIQAIKIYKDLNKLNPGLKKYNKRIEICEKASNL